MIKIFNATDTNFNTAGNIIINPLKCLETHKKSLNGWYIDVEVPIKYKEYIEQDKLCVIKTKDKINPQAFRIKNVKCKTRKIVFQARHVMFDAEDYFLLDTRPTKMTALNALATVNSVTDRPSPFTITSDVMTINTAYFIRKSLLEAWTIIEERWGGTFDADNWNISLLANVGNDNGETLIYRQNIKDMSIFEDWSNVVTKLYAVGYDGIMLPEKFIESDVKYNQPYTRTISFETDLDMATATEEELLIELKQKAEQYLEKNKIPKVSYEVNANINEKLEIGDTVHVKHPLCNILTEVLEYTYDIISKKTKSIIFGNYSRDVKAKFDSIKENINIISENISKQEKVIKYQTNLINMLNKTGYVYIDDNEILILDKLPREKAENVWRFGLGGLGFSSNGYEGPFETAITIDGQINAKFITAGVMSINRIEGLGIALDGINASIQMNTNNIISMVTNIQEQNEKLSQVTQTVNEIRSEISEVADLTKSGEGNGSVILTNINESEPVRIVVRPIREDISYLYASNKLFPSNTLFLKNRKLRFATQDYSIDWELPTNLLYYDEDNYDEFILDYEGQSCIVNKKVGYNPDGSKYILAKPVTKSYPYPTIPLEAGDYTVTVLGYPNAYLFVRLMSKNLYTDQFATKAEMNASFSLAKEQIKGEVNSRFTNYSTTVEMNAAIDLRTNIILLDLSKKVNSEDYTHAKIAAMINDDTSSILLDASKIDLKGYVTLLSLKEESSTIINGSNITTGAIDATKVTVKNLNASNISSGTIDASKIKVENLNANNITSGTLSANKISGGSLNLTGTNTTITSTNFNVDKDGNITAKSGKIGGWTINNTYLMRSIGNYNLELRTDRTADQPTILIYDTSNERYNFYIRSDGHLYARDAEINGTINASSGTFTNCTITNCNINNGQGYEINAGKIGASSVSAMAMAADIISVNTRYGHFGIGEYTGESTRVVTADGKTLTFVGGILVAVD